MKTREEKLEYKKQYRINNQDKIKKYRIEYKEKNYEKIKEYNKKYGSRTFKTMANITREQFNEMYDKQEGKCSICGRHQIDLKRRLCVDHDHILGNVRGLLCNKCNFVLGYANDDINILKNAIDYLEKYK